MAIEKGKYELWYSKGVGFATKEQAQAHEDGADLQKLHPVLVDAKKSPAIWSGIVVAAVIVVSLAVLVTKCTRASSDPTRKAANDAAMQEIKMQRVARGYVSKHLKDPDSAEFRNQSRLCGEVNAKNSFGGYIGFRRFIAANENMVVIQGDGRMDAADFDQVWKQSC